MKILFVTHDVSRYGASKSLQALIRLLPPQIECGLVVQRSIFRKTDLEPVRRQFGIEKVYATWLPNLECFVGKPHFSLKEKIWLRLNRLLSLYTRFMLPRLAEREGYQLIHLNSMVLFPLVSRSFPFSVHVRELWDGGDRRLVGNRVAKCSGLVFIDQVVRKAFAGFPARRSVVVDNPVLLSDAAGKSPAAEKQALRERLQGKLVLSIIGRVNSEKGILFLLEAMRRIETRSLALLIVGDGELEEACLTAAQDDERIVYHGPESDIDVIYEISDVLVRAEDQPRIGRTVYEALFSGISVLLPGSAADYPEHLVQKYASRMRFYRARDCGDFARAAQSLVESRPVRGERSGTDLESIERIVSFFREAAADAKSDGLAQARSDAAADA